MYWTWSGRARTRIASSWPNAGGRWSRTGSTASCSVAPAAGDPLQGGAEELGIAVIDGVTVALKTGGKPEMQLGEDRQAQRPGVSLAKALYGPLEKFSWDRALAGHRRLAGKGNNRRIQLIPGFGCARAARQWRCAMRSCACRWTIATIV